ncbi:MAG: FMN-binding negative transcriptional regulator [Chitinophagales bacterium]|nr:FMN-binding negative transcriptional regulator [Chitinophagales bacterium]MCZ2392898.1 FMN-binding negative transcriptional regulator [Chitinophagales bacterium]
MYISKEYQINDFRTIKKIIEAYPFGILCCASTVTHIPFNIHFHEESILLEGHVAANNPLVNYDGNECICVFKGPDAYISTKNYSRANSVPTWDYIAIHIYGKISFLDENENIRIVEDLMRQTSADDLDAYYQVSKDYTQRLLKGICSFKILPTKIEGIAKMSQDREASEIQTIISSLEPSESKERWDFIQWMKYFNS